jgi:hypothetical protein
MAEREGPGRYTSLYQKLDNANIPSTQCCVGSSWTHFWGYIAILQSPKCKKNGIAAGEADGNSIPIGEAEI